MIALLTGRVAYKSPDHIILDVNGVGYRVLIPFSTYYELPEEGGTASLHIHTSVREDAIQLYGFRTRLEKTFFQLLISVTGVGPKLARDILSNIQPAPLAQALGQSDIHKLSTIPGIGKKTAERLILELKEKASKLDMSSLPAVERREIHMRERAAQHHQVVGLRDDGVDRAVGSDPGHERSVHPAGLGVGGLIKPHQCGGNEDG